MLLRIEKKLKARLILPLIAERFGLIIELEYCSHTDDSRIASKIEFFSSVTLRAIGGPDTDPANTFSTVISLLMDVLFRIYT